MCRTGRNDGVNMLGERLNEDGPPFVTFPMRSELVAKGREAEFIHITGRPFCEIVEPYCHTEKPFPPLGDPVVVGPFVLV